MSYAVQDMSKKEFQEMLKCWKRLDYRERGCGRTRLLMLVVVSLATGKGEEPKKECDELFMARRILVTTTSATRSTDILMPAAIAPF